MTTAVTRTRAWAVLLAVSIPLFALSVDLNGVAILLPQIGHDFNVSAVGASGAVTAAAIGFAAPLLLVGRITDRIGARGILIGGVAGFAAASAICAFADSWALFITGRALQGVASACCFTTSLVVIDACFDARERPVAVGIWAAIGGVGSAMGPLVASGIASLVSWRAFFGVNIALGGIAVVALAAMVPRVPGDPTRALHPVRLGLLTFGIAFAVGGLQIAGNDGWGQPTTIAAILLGLVILAVALFGSHTGALVERNVLRIKSFWAGTGMATASNWGSGVALVLVPAALQSARGIDVLDAGVLFLAYSVPFALGGSVSGPVVKAQGGNETMIGGCVVQAAGLAFLAVVGLDAALVLMIAALTLAGFGNGVLYSASTSVGLSEIEPDDAGEASGLLTMLRLIGLSVGVAISTSLVHAVDDSTHSAAEGIQVALGLAALVTLSGVLCVALLGRPTTRR